jgi:NADH:ubiquinone oxidoreductase subunit 6 (subunit J)
MATLLFLDFSSELTPAKALWPMALPVLVGAVAVYLLLPRARPFPSIWGAALAGAALIAGGWALVWGLGVSPEAILFYAFSATAILSGGLLVTQLNPVHAALSFALVVLSTCGLFLLQAAPFLMAATIIVYAGAIVVTFLFVIMLAQQAGLSDADHRSREPLLSTVAGFVLLGALLYMLNRTYDIRPLNDSIERAAEAAKGATFEDVTRALGEEDRFFAEFQQAAGAASGFVNRSALESKIRDVQANWHEWKRDKNARAMRQALAELVERGIGVRDGYTKLEPHDQTREHLSEFSRPTADPNRPGDTVTPLGLMLFADYLVPVELAGTLLLVATIGAIAITGRRTGGLR